MFEIETYSFKTIFILLNLYDSEALFKKLCLIYVSSKYLLKTLIFPNNMAVIYTGLTSNSTFSGRYLVSIKVNKYCCILQNTKGKNTLPSYSGYKHSTENSLVRQE